MIPNLNMIVQHIPVLQVNVTMKTVIAIVGLLATMDHGRIVMTTESVKRD